MVGHEERACYADVTELARSHPFDNPAVGFAGMDLRSDLADAFMFEHRVLDDPALGQVQGHRFLQVDVFARLAGVHRLPAVPMVRCGNDHRVDVLLREQLAVVVVCFGALVFGGCPVQVLLPYVADGRNGDVGVGGAFVQVGRTHATGADDAELDAVVRAGLAGGGKGTARDHCWCDCAKGTSLGCTGDEITPGELLGFSHDGLLAVGCSEVGGCRNRGQAPCRAGLVESSKVCWARSQSPLPDGAKREVIC